MKAIVRKVSSSFEKALAKYFGSGPTDLNKAIMGFLNSNFENILEDNK